MPMKVEEEEINKSLYIVTADGLNYFKFGRTKNLSTRV
jgi:hypothetical protein